MAEPEVWRKPLTPSLESLTLGTLALSPSFSPDTLEYTTTYPVPSDLSETVTVNATPTVPWMGVKITYGDASADPDTYTEVENGGEIALYGVGASMSRVVLIQVGSGSDAQTYRIAVSVRPNV